MGINCSSKSNKNVEFEPDSNPYQWSQQHVLMWLKNVDNHRFDQKELIKTFSKHRIDGKALMALNEYKLKHQLKIKKVGIRLDLMEFIAKKKSCQGYPSPMHVNKYELPKYSANPCKILNNIQNTQNESLKERERKVIMHKKDVTSWTIGTTVNIFCEEYEQWIPGMIESVADYHEQWLYDGYINAVTVRYDLMGNGYFNRMTINRFNHKKIKSEERYIINRLKLSKNCVVEMFNQQTHQWTDCYIEDIDDHRDEFIISQPNQSNVLNINRWSADVRCSQSLSHLQSKSECYVYHFKYGWCWSLITDVCTSKTDQLDIFKFIYKTEIGTYHYKYLHQWSINIDAAFIEQPHPAAYSDLLITINTPDVIDNVKEDLIDAQYRDTLIKGYARMIMNCDDERAIGVLSIIMAQKNWIGPCYPLIMLLESKYFNKSIYTNN